MNTININEQGFSSSSDLSPGLTPTGIANGQEGTSANLTNRPSGTSAESYKEVFKWLKPFNHLPEELINEIFLHCASSPIEICGDPPCTPWSLAQVSRHWRTIALSEPNLWTCITVDLDWLPAVQLNQRTDALLNFFRGCLHRSHDRPLYLRVKAFQRLHPLLFPLTDLCLAEAHRWQTASLHFSLSPFIGKLEQSRGQLSLLKALSLTHEYRPAFPINAFVASPQLTRLTLSKLHHPTSSLNIPWNQITHFESNILRYKPGELDKILTNMPLLEDLKMVCGISLFPMTDNDSTNSTTISLPHLRSFHFSGREEALDQILNTLYAPSLKHFALEITDHSSSHGTPFSDLVVSAFLVLHRRSTFTLDSLSIDRLPVQSIVQILDLVPSITRLSVRCLGVTELFPTYLTLNRAPTTTARRPYYQEWGPPSSFFLVPNLRNLVMEDTYTFTDSATLTSSAGALLKMVKSRLNSEGRLESVSVVALLGVGLFDFDTSAFYALTEFGEAQGVKMDVDVRRKGGTLHNLTSLRSAN